MVNLDDPKVYRRLDPSGMLEHIHRLPEQCLSAWRRTEKFELPRTYSQICQIVVLGMGGSAIGGDFVRTLALLESKLPVWVCRDYQLPPLVDERTLIIASSYSGNTEETVTAFVQSLGGPGCKLVLTGGGKLRELAEANGVPVFHIDYAAPPRAVFGYSFISLLGVLSKLGLLSDKSREVEEMAGVLRELSTEIDEKVPLARNPAKQLARRLHEKLVVIYGAGVLSEVARRWKTQLNENSKVWAFYELFPELNHNSVVGYNFPPEISEGTFVILLRSGGLYPRVIKRYQVTEEMLSKAGVEHQSIDARGKSALAQMMSLVLLGDYVSYYLSMLNEVDPSQVRAIDYIKARLAEVE